jgi:hypothetical protein
MSRLQYEVFLRSLDFERTAEHVRMRPLDWRLLLALDGRAALADLAQRLLIDVDEAVNTIAVAERLRMVERRRVSLAEYRKEFERRREAPAEATENEEQTPEAAALEQPEELANEAVAQTGSPHGEAGPHAAEAVDVWSDALPTDAASYADYVAAQTPAAGPPLDVQASESAPIFEAEPAAGHDPFVVLTGALGEPSYARCESFDARHEDVAPYVEHADEHSAHIHYADEAPAHAPSAEPVAQEQPAYASPWSVPEPVAAAYEPAVEAEPFESPSEAVEEPFPAIVPERGIADLPLTVETRLPADSFGSGAQEEGLPSEPEVAAPAGDELAADRAIKPIEFKLKPSVQVVIR